ncbi:MAG TPA: glycerol-3-phosphate acyltransferase [Dehalococcoidales bacterium]|nr:glycerol-3-phosphate acyltransferase [Dehalococcoidales bacterium]
MPVIFGLLIIAAYLLGSIPAAYLVAKWLRGVDLRQYGSGNIGATNLAALTSKLVASPVIIFDLGKGALMVGIAHLLGLGIVAEVTVALATIIGHNWSVFLRFGGGRGLLTTVGVGFVLPSINNMVPWVIMASLVTDAIVLLITHSMPLGVCFAMLVLPSVSLGLGEPLPVILGYLIIFLILVVKRLAVPRTAIAESLSYKQLLVNRLLFDRDIRDRVIWLNWRSAQYLEKQRKD